MTSDSVLLNILIAVGLFAGLLVCLEFWFYLGKRARVRREEHPDQLATIQGATLGLLALLLGFSFALAAGRFNTRLDLITSEANAIGTAWLRCDLLPAAQRDEVRELLHRYTANRVAFYDARDDATLATVVAQAEALQAAMWGVVADAAKSSPALAQVLLPPFNEVIDMHGLRVAAMRRHMQVLLVVLLLASSLVSVASVGYGCGVAGKRNVLLTTALIFLIAGVLWAIIDMDHPRKGLIRADDKPMQDLLRTTGRQSLPQQGASR